MEVAWCPAVSLRLDNIVCSALIKGMGAHISTCILKDIDRNEDIACYFFKSKLIKKIFVEVQFSLIVDHVDIIAY